jgi:hypothetical protein
MAQPCSGQREYPSAPDPSCTTDATGKELTTCVSK